MIVKIHVYMSINNVMFDDGIQIDIVTHQQ